MKEKSRNRKVQHFQCPLLGNQGGETKTILRKQNSKEKNVISVIPKLSLIMRGPYLEFLFYSQLINVYSN